MTDDLMRRAYREWCAEQERQQSWPSQWCAWQAAWRAAVVEHSADNHALSPAIGCKYREAAEGLRRRVDLGLSMDSNDVIDLSLLLAEASDELTQARGGNLVRGPWSSPCLRLVQGGG